MFRAGHIIFIIISLALVAVGLLVIRRRRPTIERLIRVCLAIAVVCEVVKLFMIIEIVPVVDATIADGQIVYQETGDFSPYLKTQHLPLELCSLQMAFMFLSLVVRSPVWKHRIYALIYGTALPGGLAALLLSSIAPDFETAAAFLSSPLAWEFFIYHALIIMVALAIGLDKECDIRFPDVRWPICALLCLDFTSLYLNSILSVPVFQNGELMGLTYSLNFFSSYNDPVGITLATKSSYLTYFALRYVIGVVLLVVTYAPLLRRGPAPSRHGEA